MSSDEVLADARLEAFSDRLRTLTADAFESLIGNDFEVRHEGKSLTRFTVSEVTRYPHNRLANQREPFSVLLTGSKKELLHTGTYLLVSEEMDELLIFVSPVIVADREVCNDVQHYEAVFS